jgi:hypothetical protein
MFEFIGGSICSAFVDNAVSVAQAVLIEVIRERMSRGAEDAEAASSWSGALFLYREGNEGKSLRILQSASRKGISSDFRSLIN